MMTVGGCPSLLMNDAPRETWGQVGTWLVLSEARAQAPICSTSVFLLTWLKLWDLEHTLGCRDKVRSTHYTARQTVYERQRRGTPVSLSHQGSSTPQIFPIPHLSAQSGLAVAGILNLSSELCPDTSALPQPVRTGNRSHPKPDLEAPDPGLPPPSSSKGARP